MPSPRFIFNECWLLIFSILFLCCAPVFAGPQSLPGTLIQTNKISGESLQIIDGQVLSEGSAWNAHGAVVFKDLESYVIVDFGQAVSARGFLLQAGADDVYHLRSSLDGQNWESLSYAHNLRGEQGLGFRKVKLYKPSFLRYVALNPVAGDGQYSVSEFSVYETVPLFWGAQESLSRGTKDIAIVVLLLMIPVLVVIFVLKKFRQKIELAPGMIVGLTVSLVLLGLFGFLTQPHLEYYKFYRYVIKAALLGFALWIIPMGERTSGRE